VKISESRSPMLPSEFTTGCPAVRGCADIHLRFAPGEVLINPLERR
jgi:hypothetical protein